MAFDGITVAAVTKELNDKLSGGRVYKIAQPEEDALLLTIKTQGGQYRLLLSADASLPLVYLTDVNKPSPMTAPNFGEKPSSSATTPAATKTSVE